MAENYRLKYPPSSPTYESTPFTDRERQHPSEGSVNIDSPPDGGLRAWMTVLGAWFILFGTFGYFFAFGVFQDFYTRGYLTRNTPSQISWIGSIQYMLPFFVGLFSGKLFDAGHFHVLSLTGNALFIFSLFMLSLAKPLQYYQVFLSQGVGMGLGLGLLFLPTLAITSHHFQKRRALVVGISLSGSAIGAIIFPIMLNQLLLVKGMSFGSSVRATAYLVLGLLIIGNLLMRTRYPPGKKEPPPIAEFFREPSYLLLILNGLLAAFGLFFPIFYMQLYAIKQDLDPTLAFYTIAIINAASVVGRIFVNYLADSMGPVNLITVSSAGTALSIWLMLAIHNSAALVIVCILYGFFSGAYLSLVIAVLASISKKPSHIGSKTGLCLAIVSFAFLGSGPAQGAVLTSQFKWTQAIVFSGVFTTAAFFVLLITLHVLAKEKGSRRI